MCTFLYSVNKLPHVISKALAEHLSMQHHYSCGKKSTEHSFIISNRATTRLKNRSHRKPYSSNIRASDYTAYQQKSEGHVGWVMHVHVFT